MIQESLMNLDASAVQRLNDELNAINCDSDQMTDDQWERYNRFARHVIEPYDICDPERYGLDWDSMELESLTESDDLAEAFYKHCILNEQLDPAIHEFVKIVGKIGY
jgi:hypothetical protein